MPALASSGTESMLMAPPIICPTKSSRSLSVTSRFAGKARRTGEKSSTLPRGRRRKRATKVKSLPSMGAAQGG